MSRLARLSRLSTLKASKTQNSLTRCLTRWIFRENIRQRRRFCRAAWARLANCLMNQAWRLKIFQEQSNGSMAPVQNKAIIGWSLKSKVIYSHFRWQRQHSLAVRFFPKPPSGQGQSKSSSVFFPNDHEYCIHECDISALDILKHPNIPSSLYFGNSCCSPTTNCFFSNQPEAMKFDPCELQFQQMISP